MAYMGRGGINSVGNANRGSSQGNNFRDNLKEDCYRIYRYGKYRYVQVDNSYIIIQMIIAFIILITGLIAYITSYESTIVDPIESVKKLFSNGYLISMGILLVVTLITNFYSKTRTILLKRLKVIFSISILIIIMFFGLKLYLDTVYTEEMFQQIYSEQNIEESSENSNKSVINIGIAEIGVKTEKEHYIDECLELYNIFSIKVYIILGINLLLIILLIYQISRISKAQRKKEQTNKDVLILFDEEENVKN